MRSLTGPGSRYLVSAEGGREPAWGRGGRELYYRNGNRLMAAQLATAGGFAVQARTTIMETPALAGRGNRNYDVAPDGSGFLMLRSSAPPRLGVRLAGVAARTH